MKPEVYRKMLFALSKRYKEEKVQQDICRSSKHIKTTITGTKYASLLANSFPVIAENSASNSIQNSKSDLLQKLPFNLVTGWEIYEDLSFSTVESPSELFEMDLQPIRKLITICSCRCTC
ncbi:hypothetical protein TNCV_2618871 [Trichonephila clavipes]|nr:hypothetical protein TNCV_2618871 [Trichonephila clavipes]